MKVIVTEPIHHIPLEHLRQHVDVVCWDDKDVTDWSYADAVIVRAASVTREQILSAPKLKVIGKHGIGVNSIDVEAAQKAGVKVVYTPTSNVNSVAELIISMMLTLARKLPQNMTAIRVGAKKIAPVELTGLELSGKTLGLIGFGRISQRVAEICQKGFGMHLHT